MIFSVNKLKKLFFSLGIILLISLAFFSLFFFTGCDGERNLHDYQIQFRGGDLGTVTVGQDFFVRIPEGSFTPSRDGQRLYYTLDSYTSQALPMGLVLRQDDGGAYIRGTIRPSGGHVRMGNNIIRVAASIIGGEHSRVVVDFSLLVLPGQWGTPDYNFTFNFLENTDLSNTDNKRVSIGVDGALEGTLEVNFDNEWLELATGDFVTISVQRGETIPLQVRYAQCIRGTMIMGDTVGISFSTKSEHFEDDFFIVDNNGTLTSFSDFFISYFAHTNITIPNEVNGITVTAISWQALSGIVNNGINVPAMPRFPLITVPSTVTRITGVLGSRGIHYRQGIRFLGTSQIQIDNPLPIAAGDDFMRGGRFVVPHSAVANFRNAMPNFGQTIDGVNGALNYTRNVFSDQFLENDYYLVVPNLMVAGFPRRALVSYFGAKTLSRVPSGVQVLLPKSFYQANHMLELILPNSIALIFELALEFSFSIARVQTIFFEGNIVVWGHIEIQDSEQLRPISILFFSQDAPTDSNQWRFVSENGILVPRPW